MYNVITFSLPRIHLNNNCAILCMIVATACCCRCIGISCSSFNSRVLANPYMFTPTPYRGIDYCAMLISFVMSNRNYSIILISLFQRIIIMPRARSLLISARHLTHMMHAAACVYLPVRKEKKRDRRKEIRMLMHRIQAYLVGSGELVYLPIH